MARHNFHDGWNSGPSGLQEWATLIYMSIRFYSVEQDVNEIQKTEVDIFWNIKNFC